MIPFLDLHRINERFTVQFKEQFDKFLDAGWYILGEEVQQFEKEFAQYCGTKYCVGTANGLDALRLILEGYKIQGKLKKGDEVLVAANTYIATILGIKQAGLVPVLVEAENQNYNFDFNDLEQRLSPATKVIMPTHLYGQLADMKRVNAFAKANDLLVITDSAQSHGAIASSGNRSGDLGHASAFSFYPTKNLGALGDGGAITTNDEELAVLIAKLRNYGFDERYVSKYVGMNSRLDEIQAAFLRIKLRQLDADNEARRRVARRYMREITNDKIHLPAWSGNKDHVFHLFVVRTARREELQLYLKERSVGTIIHYPIPPHKQEALIELSQLSFPVTEAIHAEILSIPIGPLMSETEITTIIDAINSF